MFFWIVTCVLIHVVFHNSKTYKLLFHIYYMRKMLALFTLGFDEKFAIRALLRRGLRSEDLVTVLIPEKRRDPRTDKAISLLDMFLKTALGKANMHILEIPIEDFSLAISKIRSYIISRPERPIYANLSGSMRVLVIETLIAIISTGLDAEIEVEAEDGSLIVSFRTWEILPERLDNIDLEILKRSLEVISLPELSKQMNMPKSTVWRRVVSLSKKGLIEIYREGRTMKLKTSRKGSFYI